MVTQVQSLVAKAKIAQQELESYNQEQIDELVRRIALVVFENAEMLSKLAVEESSMGSLEHKILKKKGKARILWHSLKGKQTMGVISHNTLTGITEIAKPVGIVGAIQPCTNPIVTPMANAMAAIKCKNSIIVSPHPRTVNCTKVFLDLVYDSWRDLSYPKNIIQMLDEPKIDAIKELMSSVDVVVATGGPQMVKSAYSSGKPSFGVGPGNVQCIVDRDVDYAQACDKIIHGRVFDNGIICSGEQSVMVPIEQKKQIQEMFKARNTYFVEGDDVTLLKSSLFPNGITAKEMVGQDASAIASKIGINVPDGTLLLAVDADNEPLDSVLRKEKMFPVIAYFSYEKFEDALKIAEHNLSIEGKGHSVSIHSTNKKHIEELGQVVKVSRVLVNQPCATTSGGSFTNGLAPTSTLGCGSWGNNSISENFTYKHLMNITRIAYELTDATIPSDEELWGSL